MTPASEAWQITSTGEWLRRRQGLLTASNMAALFDQHPYVSRGDLASIIQGVTVSTDSVSKRRGRMFQAAIEEGLKEDHPDWDIRRASTFHSIAELRLGSTPDLWATIEGLKGTVECKTVAPDVWERWGNKPPLYISLQALGQLVTTGCDVAVIAVMVMTPSYPIYEFRVERHPAAEKRLLDACAAWWEDYDAGRIAPAANAEGLAEALDDGSVIDLSDNNLLCVAIPERQELKATISGAEKRVAEIDSILKDAMGNASTARIPGFTITWKSQYRKETVIPAKTMRVLRVSPVKETAK